MATGFKVYRTDSTVQIDDAYKTLTLKEIQTAAVSVTTGTTLHTITVTANNVMVAVRAEVLLVSTYVAQVSGTTWNLIFAFQSDIGAAVENVRFYIFTDPDIAPGSYLNIYDSAGVLMFSDETRPIRIRGVVTGNTGWSGTSGRLYAPVLLARTDTMTYYNGVLWDIGYYFYRCTGVTITATSRFVRRQAPIRRQPVGSYLVADVTDY